MWEADIISVHIHGAKYVEKRYLGIPQNICFQRHVRNVSLRHKLLNDNKVRLVKL